MKPLKHSGDSANIAYYGEPGPEREGRVWAHVLREDVTFRGGKAERKPVPDFGFRVCVTGKGEVAEFTYTPKTRPRAGRLPERTVTRLVRERLKGPS